VQSAVTSYINALEDETRPSPGPQLGMTTPTGFPSAKVGQVPCGTQIIPFGCRIESQANDSYCRADRRLRALQMPREDH
jgi:hypothetical protein